jgi:hypothetical protein
VPKARHAAAATAANHATTATEAKHAAAATEAGHALVADAIPALNWQPLTLQNSWANLGTGNVNIDTTGKVRLYNQPGESDDVSGGASLDSITFSRY